MRRLHWGISMDIAPTVAWAPERYVIENDEPPEGVHLYDVAQELVIMRNQDSPDDFDDIEVPLQSAAAFTNNREFDAEVVIDFVEMPGRQVWYLWRVGEMLAQDGLTDVQKEVIEQGCYAAAIGFITARIETYRHAFPDKILTNEMIWANGPLPLR